jgi:hypothetical protein
LTPRIIREETEKRFSLDPGTLDAPEYKKAIKEAISAAVHLVPFNLYVAFQTLILKI